MKLLPMTLILAAGFAGTAIAQQAAQQAAEEPVEGHTLPTFAAVDKNEDGKIDQAEAEVLTEALKDSDMKFDFKTADANEDGAIDAAEYTRYQEKMKA